LNSNNKKATYKEFFECSKTTFIAFGGFFFEFLTTSTLGGHNFLSSIPFVTIFNVPYAPIGGVQVLFGHQKQQSSPLGSCFP